MTSLFSIISFSLEDYHLEDCNHSATDFHVDDRFVYAFFRELISRKNNTFSSLRLPIDDDDLDNCLNITRLYQQMTLNMNYGSSTRNTKPKYHIHRQTLSLVLDAFSGHPQFEYYWRDYVKTFVLHYIDFLIDDDFVCVPVSASIFDDAIACSVVCDPVDEVVGISPDIVTSVVLDPLPDPIPDLEIPEVVNAPIDYLELEAREADFKEQKRLQAHKHVKVAKWVPKTYKKPNTRPTVQLNTIPPLVKKRYIQMGITASTSVDFDRVWFMRPSSHRDHHIDHWIKWVSLYNPTVNDLLQLHFAAIPERDGLPSAVGLKFYHFKPQLRNVKDYSALYESVLAEHLKSAHHPDGKLVMTPLATVELMCDLWACAMRYHDNWVDAYAMFHSWLCNVDRGLCTVNQKFSSLHPAGLGMFYSCLARHGISKKTYNYAKITRDRFKNPISVRAKVFDWTKPVTVKSYRAISRMPEFEDYVLDTKIHVSIVNTLMQFWTDVPVNHDADKSSWESLLGYTYNWVVKPKLALVVEETTATECPNCDNAFCKNRESAGPCDTDDGFSTRFFDNVKSFGSSFVNSAKNLVPDVVNNLLTTLQQQLKELKDVVHSLLGRIRSLLTPILKFLNIAEVDMGNTLTLALDIVRYYVIYINTESTAIHALCVFAILHTLGIYQRVYDCFITWMNDGCGDIPEPENESGPEATMDLNIFSRLKSVFSCLVSKDPATVAIPLGFLVILFCGISLKGKELATLGRDFVCSMRNLHFIGGGILGISRLFDALIKSVKFVLEWVGKKFFSQVPEDEKEAQALKDLTERFVAWTTEVTVLSGEELVGKLASDVRIHDRVEDCFERGIEFNKMYYHDQLSQTMMRGFPALWKSCKELHNIIMRSRTTADFRPTPFHVQLHGEPGIGKSTLMHTISTQIGDTYFPNNRNLVYAQGMTEQMDNYLQQPIFLIDDMFPANDYKMVIPLLAMVSNSPLMLYTSHLWSKGTYFTSKWILSTTNTNYPEFNGLFNNQAIWRRRHILATVKMDPKVRDPSTGKFSLDLFNKEYPGQDSRTYPHLRFTLMNPVVNQKLGEVKELPTGIVHPTENISFSEFMIRVKARNDAQAKEEALFDSDAGLRFTHLRKYLSEIDDVYASIRSQTGHSSPLYENNYDDGAKKTPPAMTTFKEGNYVPPNLDEVTEDEVYHLLRKQLLMFSGSDSVNKIRVLDACLDRLERFYKEPSPICFCSDHTVKNFCDSFQDLYLAMLTLSALGESPVHRTRLDRIVSVIRKCQFCDFGPAGRHFVSSFDSVVMERLFPRFMAISMTTQQLTTGYIALKVLSLVFEVPLPKLNPQLLIVAREELATWTPEKTTGLDESHTFHISADWDDDHLRDIEEEKSAEMVTIIQGIFRLFEENEEDCDLLVYRDVVYRNLSESDPDINLLRRSLDDLLAQNPLWRDLVKGNLHLRTLFSDLKLLGIVCAHLTVIHVEQRVRLIRAKRGYPNATTSDYASNGHTGVYFASAANYKRGFGYLIKEDLSFGLSVAPNWFSSPTWIPYPAPFVDFVDKTFTGYGNIYLSEAEWSVLFPNEPWVDGNTHIENGFMRYLKFGPPLRAGGQNSYYYECTGLEKLVDYLNSQPMFGAKLHINATQLISARTNFRRSIDRFLSMTPHARHIFFSKYSKHWFISNVLISLKTKVSLHLKSTVSSVWDSMTGGLSYMWDKVSDYKLPISLIVLAGAIIGGCTMFAHLFIPTPTSFRGSKIFASQHKGLSTYTANSPAKKAVDGTIRCILDGASFQGYKIWESCLLVPWHAVSPVKFQSKRDFYLSLLIAPGVTHTFTINAKNIHYFEGSDCAMIFQPNFPAWGQRIKYLKTSAEFDVEKGEIALVAYRDVDGKLISEETQYEGTQRRVTTKFSDGLSISHSFVGVLQGFVNKGVSGSPIFLNTLNSDQMSIAGFQSYRHNGYSYYTMVSRETVQQAIDIVVKGVVKVTSPFVYSTDPVQETTLAILDPHMEIIGSVPREYRTAQPPNTEFTKTRISDVFITKRVPAILSPSSPYFDRSQVDPARHSLNKHGRDSMREIPQHFIDQAIREYTEYYRSLIKKPRIYTPYEAIEGVGNLKHIDLNTSPGIPWIFKRTKKGKKSFIEIDELGKLVYADPELIESCFAFEKSFKNLETPPFTMVEILKDELRPIGKAYGLTDDQVVSLYAEGVPPSLWPSPRVCKTRTITVMPMEFTIIYRRYFADFFSQLYTLANTGTQPYCVGINCESMAAYQAYVAAKSRSNFGIDLDVSNWDGHFSPQLYRAVIAIVNGIYDDTSANLRLGLALSACFGHVQYKDAVYRKYWGMPSGFPGTADFNTLGHMIVGYAQWLELCSQAAKFDYCYLHVYQHYVLDLYYGDDRLIVVHPDVSNIFSVHSLMTLYEKYGWPVTSAAKTGKFDLVPVEELQFLKRKWIVDQLNPLYVHWAMDKSTIEDLCLYVRRSFEPRKQFYENLYTALDFACDWSKCYYDGFARSVNYALCAKKMAPLNFDYDSKYREKLQRYMGVDPSLLLHSSQTTPSTITEMRAVKQEDLEIDEIQIEECDLSVE
nr:RNA-dependent RNA polymerase [Polycipiviridae sp.]